MLTHDQISLLRLTPVPGGDGSGPRNRVRIAMALRGVKTQQELASLSGISLPVVGRVLRDDHRQLPLATAQRFAEFFGCAVDDLFPASGAGDEQEVIQCQA